MPKTSPPYKFPQHNTPIPKPTVIKLIFQPGRIDCRIRRTNRGPEKWRCHKNLTPATAKRITNLANWLDIDQGWLSWPEVDGWLVTSPQEAQK